MPASGGLCDDGEGVSHHELNIPAMWDAEVSYMPVTAYITSVAIVAAHNTCFLLLYFLTAALLAWPSPAVGSQHRGLVVTQGLGPVAREPQPTFKPRSVILLHSPGSEQWRT